MCVFMYVHTDREIRHYRSRNALRLGSSGVPALRGARPQERAEEGLNRLLRKKGCVVLCRWVG